ncbi:unnamed protein product [Protopolystoma xenopodis]|uniref:Uncharacterized protein n=1 Tax=Protopolystoma xenopodis TaxID=117903 RepID=A0A448WWU4_9PLAT|nr:unnamed protein product [Protopolystoma xenopodis]
MGLVGVSKKGRDENRTTIQDLPWFRFVHLARPSLLWSRLSLKLFEMSTSLAPTAIDMGPLGASSVKALFNRYHWYEIHCLLAATSIVSTLTLAIPSSSGEDSLRICHLPCVNVVCPRIRQPGRKPCGGRA